MALEASESKWQTKYFAFTWNRKDAWSEDDFTAMVPVLESNLRRIAKHWIFQIERGEETQRLHYQGYFELKFKKRLLTLAKEMAEWAEGIHLSPASTAGRQSLQQYCLKTETRHDGPWTDAGRPSSEAHLLAADPFDGRAVFHFLEDPMMRRPFQETLRKAVLGPVHQRKIFWVGDTIGNTGKSEWADWMEWKYGAETVSYGTAKDVMSLILSRPASKAYLFTLPRSRPKDAALTDLYNVLEMVKDGKLINHKYECSKIRIARPHVFVLANYFPNQEERKHLSDDRWGFFHVTQDTYRLADGVEQHQPMIPMIPVFRPINDDAIDEFGMGPVIDRAPNPAEQDELHLD